MPRETSPARRRCSLSGPLGIDHAPVLASSLWQWVQSPERRDERVVRAGQVHQVQQLLNGGAFFDPESWQSSTRPGCPRAESSAAGACP